MGNWHFTHYMLGNCNSLVNMLGGALCNPSCFHLSPVLFLCLYIRVFIKYFMMTFFTMEYCVRESSLVAQLVKNLPAMWETWVWSLGWEDPWGRERLPTPVFWPGEFQDYIVHGVAKSWMRLNNFHFTEHWRMSLLVSRQTLGLTLDLFSLHCFSVSLSL